MTYKVYIPFQDDMGNISPMVVSSTPMETKEENALWHLNSMRQHDGLPNLDELPDGTYFEKIG